MRNRFLAAFAAIAMLFGLGTLVTTPAIAGSEWNAKPTTAKKADHKGHPPVFDMKTGKLDSKRMALLGSPKYHYTGWYQHVGDGTAGNGSTQIASLVSQHNPVIAYPADDNHSLFEIAAQSRDGNQIAEIGWHVNPGWCAGGVTPCLFTYSWVNGVGQGYNTSSTTYYKDNPNESIGGGTPLAYTASGSVPTNFYQYRIERVTNPSWCTGTCGTPAGFGTGWQFAWMASGVDHIIGGIKDTQWTGASTPVTFDKIQTVQGFTELYDYDDTLNSCGDQGSGAYGASTATSSLDHKAYSHGGAPLDPFTGVTEVNEPNGIFVTPAADTPSAYRAYQYPTDLDRMRLGGPGRNSTDTGAGSVGAC
jgi:hypothetical protein